MGEREREQRDHSIGVRMCSMKGLIGSLAREALWQYGILANWKRNRRSTSAIEEIEGRNGGNVRRFEICVP